MLTGTLIAISAAGAAENGPKLLPANQDAAAEVSVEETAIAAPVADDVTVIDARDVAPPCDRRAPCCGICFPQDQLWLISTRRLRVCGPSPGEPDVWCYEPDGGWRTASLQEFLASDDPATPTSVWIHGNRTSYGQSRTVGRQVFERLRPWAATDAPLRLVIWSWPSDRIRGPLNDSRAKADRSDVDAYHLAAVIDRIDPRVPVGLVGYSYGARIATGALHMLGGGSIRGNTLDASVVALPRPLRAALLAGALNNYWLLPAEMHGRAVPQVERMLVTKNPSDKVLKYYPITAYGRIRTGPQALGFYGVPGVGRLGTDSQKVWQLCVTPWVGRDHDLENYVGSSAIMSRVGPYAMFDGWNIDQLELASATEEHVHE